jgi:hypothetical protein
MTKTEAARSTIAAWFAGRLPEEWTATAPPRVTVDREEITVVLSLPGPNSAEGASEAEVDEAVAGWIARFREETRERRIAIAREAEHRFRRKVAWGLDVLEREELFTHLAVPVMTRLRQPERQVLDTLVEGGVARSRAHALAWCVRLVGRNAETWLADLRQAMTEVERVRSAGPEGTRSEAPTEAPTEAQSEETSTDKPA